MSRRATIRYFDLLTSAGGSQTLDGNFQTDLYNHYATDNLAIVISTTGVTANTGTFSVQFRLKDVNAPSDPESEWVDLGTGAELTLANANVDHLINLNQLPPGQVRVAFTLGTGTDGSATIKLSGNSIGS